RNVLVEVAGQRTAFLPQRNRPDVHAAQRVRLRTVGGSQREHVDRIAGGDKGFGLTPHARVALIVALDDETDRFNRMTHGRQEARERSWALVDSCRRTMSGGLIGWPSYTTRTPEPRPSSRTKRTRRRARNQSTACD